MYLTRHSCYVAPAQELMDVTQCGQDYSMTHIKLAYVGSGNFKFFVPVHLQDQADFVDKADVPDKVPEPPHRK